MASTKRRSMSRTASAASQPSNATTAVARLFRGGVPSPLDGWKKTSTWKDVNNGFSGGITTNPASKEAGYNSRRRRRSGAVVRGCSIRDLQAGLYSNQVTNTHLNSDPCATRGCALPSKFEREEEWGILQRGG